MRNIDPNALMQSNLTGTQASGSMKKKTTQEYSKMSSYRQKYYDHMNMTATESMADNESHGITVTGKSSALTRNKGSKPFAI